MSHIKTQFTDRE